MRGGPMRAVFAIASVVCLLLALWVGGPNGDWGVGWAFAAEWRPGHEQRAPSAWNTPNTKTGRDR